MNTGINFSRHSVTKQINFWKKVGLKLMNQLQFQCEQHTFGDLTVTSYKNLWKYTNTM
jgi:hypothetical protein